MQIHLEPEILFFLFGIPISNSFVLAWLAGGILIGGGFYLVRSLKPIPGKFQSTIEVFVEGSIEFMSQTLGGNRKQAMQFFPLVAAFFLFILLNNWLGILPGVGSIGFFQEYHGEQVLKPIFRGANSDLNTTLALALISVVGAQIYGMKKLGFFTQASKYIVLNKGPVFLFVGLLELVGELAKVLSFSFRLFGNIFAGKVLLVVALALVPFLAPVPFYGLELFIGFIQAFIFAMLTLVFLKIATEGHAEEH
ncbi:MAG: F0F1 ATP synthase subunit A [Candidatus Yanofskybacteria bacterium]|nr:F0F1 ATP synthase subunit A [Candidatus Yanofskybacteria bacterium]